MASSIPSQKTDKVPLPLGEDPKYYVRATDVNGLIDALTGAGDAITPKMSGGFITATGASVIRTAAEWQTDRVNALGFTGVDRTGVTDSAIGAQAAITYAASVGKAVYFPAGTYKFASGLTLPAGTVLEGDGLTATVFVFSASAVIDAAITISSVSNVTIRKLRLSGATSPASVGRMIAALTVTNLRISEVQIDGAGAGTPASGPRAGVYLYAVSDVTIEKSVFTGNGSLSPATPDGYDIVAGYIYTTNYRVNVGPNNRFYNSRTVISVMLFDTRESKVFENTIDQNNMAAGTSSGGYGISFYTTVNAPDQAHGSAEATVSNNTIRNTAGSGIYLESVQGATIVGNRLYDVVKQQDGVSLPAAGIAVNSGAAIAPYSYGIAIAGNSVETSGKEGIDVAHTQGAAISGNALRNCRYGVSLRADEPGAAVTGNAVISAGGAGTIGIYLRAAAAGVSVTSNSVIGAANGIQVSGAHVNVQIAKNVLATCGTSGTGAIVLTTGSGATVEGNTVTNATGYGIYDSGSNAKHRGNTITGTTGSAVRLETTATGAVIENNDIRTSSAYAVSDGGTYNTIRNNFLFASSTGPYAVPGTYAGGTTYALGNSVVYNGSWFTSLQAGNVGHQPDISPTWWSTTPMPQGNRLQASSAIRGVAVLAAGVASVNSAEVRTGDVIRVARQAAGGTAGHLVIGSIVNGVSFAISSTSGTDTSTVEWEIVH